jgi:pantetheine-phosphate adenylyltransferase
MKKAIYAFSGDPITYGHIDVIVRASRIFDEIIVAIGVNPIKKYLFNTAEREDMARTALAPYKNVTVTSFKGMLPDFAYQNGVNVLLRGLRNPEDFNFELMLHQLSETQIAGIETFLIPCSQKMAHISSSAAKAIQLEQGLIHELVPLNVKQKLEQKISGQLIIGITGSIGSGKSHLAKGLLDEAMLAGIGAYHIDMDVLGHEILEQLTEPVYHKFRQNLTGYFGESILTAEGFINTSKLAGLLFGNKQALKHFNTSIYTPLMLRLRKELYGKRGLILLESALLAETNSLFYCNNHVILARCEDEIRNERLSARGYNSGKIHLMNNAQFTQGKKLKIIRSRIEADGFGKLWMADAETNVADLLNSITQMLNAAVLTA